VRQVVPIVPGHLKPLLTRAIVVEVKLSVDAEGRVTNAEAAAGGGVLAHLGRVSQDAARQWRFQPATLNGKPVPSVHVVQFKFGK
jgi:TonB family protein